MVQFDLETSAPATPIFSQHLTGKIRKTAVSSMKDRSRVRFLQYDDINIRRFNQFLCEGVHFDALYRAH